MKKTVFLIVLFLASTVFALINPVLALPSDRSKSPWLLTPQERVKLFEEMKKASGSGRSEAEATPPGLLREKNAIASAKNKTIAFVGRITATSAANLSFTLSTKNGPKTVLTNPQTKFLAGGLKNGTQATFSSLKVGDLVVAIGQLTSQWSLTAKVVVVNPQGQRQNGQTKRRAVYGVVESKVASGSETLLTLRHPLNVKTFKVLANSSTKITGKDLSNGTIADIKIGNRITAVGTVNENGVITAKRIHIIPGLGRGIFGTQPSASSSSNSALKNRQASPPGNRRSR